MREQTKTKWTVGMLTGIAMISAVAYVVMLAGFHFMSAAPFLKYEAKDVIITIGGFIYGPAGAVAASFIVALTEMLTVSSTGPQGFLMNFLAAASFSVTASLVYRKKRTAAGAAGGLAVGVFSLTAVMLLWNYIITPLYTGWPREAVAAMLLPVFMPFNLIKGGLNAALVLLIYKPLITALRTARLLPDRALKTQEKTRFKANVGLMVFAAVLLAACAVAILIYMK